MKRILTVLAFALFPGSLSAEIKDITIDYYRWHASQHGLVSGTVTFNNEPLVLVTVENAGFNYTTAATPEGKWSVVITPYDTRVSAYATAPFSGAKSKILEFSKTSNDKGSLEAVSFESYWMEPCAYWSYTSFSNGRSGYLCDFKGPMIQIPDASSLGQTIEGLDQRLTELEKHKQ